MSDIKYAISSLSSSFDPCSGKTVRHTLLPIPGTSNVLHLSRNRRSIVCFSAVAIAIARSIVQDLHIIPDIACTSSGTNAHCAIWHNGFHCLPIESLQEGPRRIFLRHRPFHIGGLASAFFFGASNVAATLKVIYITKSLIQNQEARNREPPLMFAHSPSA